MLLRNITMLNPFRDDVSVGGNRSRSINMTYASTINGETFPLNYSYAGNDSNS